MKITYTPNPLSTVIELDDHEKEILRLKIKINLLEEDLGSAAVCLNPKNASWVMKPSTRRPEGHTIETLIAEVLDDYLDLSYMYSEGEYEGKGLDARVDEIFQWYLHELQANHAGDCTCFPASCCKCHAESFLGICTIPGLGKHEAYKIERAFSYKDDETWRTRTLSEAMEILRKSHTDWQTSSDSSPHAPRWRAEAERALKWMEQYIKDHPECAE